MIKLFNITDKTFNSNGDIVLQPLKAKVHNEDNGEFYLDLELGLDYSDYLTSGKIITANIAPG